MITLVAGLHVQSYPPLPGGLTDSVKLSLVIRFQVNMPSLPKGPARSGIPVEIPKVLRSFTRFSKAEEELNRGLTMDERSWRAIVAKCRSDVIDSRAKDETKLFRFAYSFVISSRRGIRRGERYRDTNYGREEFMPAAWALTLLPKESPEVLRCRYVLEGWAGAHELVGPGRALVAFYPKDDILRIGLVWQLVAAGRAKNAGEIDRHLKAISSDSYDYGCWLGAKLHFAWTRAKQTSLRKDRDLCDKWIDLALNFFPKNSPLYNEVASERTRR